VWPLCSRKSENGSYPTIPARWFTKALKRMWALRRGRARPFLPSAAPAPRAEKGKKFGWAQHPANNPEKKTWGAGGGVSGPPPSSFGLVGGHAPPKICSVDETFPPAAKAPLPRQPLVVSRAYCFSFCRPRRAPPPAPATALTRKKNNPYGGLGPRSAAPQGRGENSQ